MLSSTILAKNSANLLSTPVESEIQYASLCIQQGEPQQALARYIVLLLNYQYGLSTIIKTSIDAVSTPEPQYQGTIRCYFVINNRVPSTAILTQFLDKQIPLILLCPEATLVATKPNNSDNLSYCSWDQAFRPQQPVLPQIIATIFAKYQIPKLYEAGFDNPAKINPKHIGHLINNVETLPTLPQIILHIMRLVHDPKSTTEQLEKVVLSDPAIVHKLLQVVNSPTFAGLAHTGQWTLKDALIRLGRRKIGAIAQQVKLINTFAKEQESNFDMHRFWQHSASCAIIADRIYEKKWSV